MFKMNQLQLMWFDLYRSGWETRGSSWDCWTEPRNTEEILAMVDTVQLNQFQLICASQVGKHWVQVGTGQNPTIQIGILAMAGTVQLINSC
jgi:hypothetical protein